ncbi:hypothetical protein [Pedobacter sp. AJM]|uniref:hypothetical protein n=1 Tax=Pedobacter sp. AJM TaxID=2003629 RepID=UPI00112513F6|nr:hypothetical protein [Pedobacter sp. AJM]
MKRMTLWMVLLVLMPFLGLAQVRDNAGLKGSEGAISGFFETLNPINYPTGASGWWHMIDVRHSSPDNNYAMQFSGSFFDQQLYFRKTNNLASQQWSKILMEVNGNVGIGTSNPATRLEVMAPQSDLTSAAVFHLNGKQAWGNVITLATNGQSGNDDARMLFSYRNKAKQWSIGGGHAINGFGIWEDAGDGSYGSGFGSDRFMVAPGGNIGIGVSDPKEKLVVNGNIRAMLSDNLPEKNVAGIVSLGNSGITGAKNWALRGVYQHGNGVGINQDGGDLDLIKSLDGNIILATKTDGSAMGNVGIGFVNPNEKLAVNGTVRAKEVKVTAEIWPDYVFSKKYAMMPLAELAQYIQTHKHLPEIPSAAQVNKEGIALGEMNRLLLQKLEELTLHLIEKDKQINAMQATQVEQLKMIEAIQKKLK